MQSFSSKGLATGCVTGKTNAAMLAGVSRGEYQLVFFTPEMLLNDKKWRLLLQGDDYKRRVRGLVIDEAHTVKKWYVYVSIILSLQ